MASNNATGRRVATYLTSDDEGYSPILDILSDASFSLDPRATADSYIDPLTSFRIRNQ